MDDWSVSVTSGDKEPKIRQFTLISKNDIGYNKVAWKHLSFMCHDLLFWWGIFTDGLAAGGPHGEGTISPLVKNWTNKKIYRVITLFL